jgi:hypothetical protein
MRSIAKPVLRKRRKKPPGATLSALKTVRVLCVAVCCCVLLCVSDASFLAVLGGLQSYKLNTALICQHALDSEDRPPRRELRKTGVELSLPIPSLTRRLCTCSSRPANHAQDDPEECSRPVWLWRCVAMELARPVQRGVRHRS